jgi:hypothetical protein
MKTLYLYTTQACHLCEQAEALLTPQLQTHDCHLERVEISGSDELMERYGIRIPVLQRLDSGAELGWPFDADQLRVFLS